MGAGMETRTYSKYRYLISVVAFIDFPLWVAIRHHDWTVAIVLFIAMTLLAVRRFAEASWRGAWAALWCFETVSPLALLYFFPGVNPWLVLLCVVALQIPLMLWPSMKPEEPRAEPGDV
jgi:uncharacterized membrane protein YhaH (DUF805 family)